MGSNEFRGVTKRSNGWQISFTYKGKRYREMVVYPHTSKGKQEARDRLGKVRTEISLGTFDYERLFPNSRAIRKNKRIGTVAAELNRWIDLNSKRLQLSTRQGYTYIINKHLLPNFGHLGIEVLSREDVLGWIARSELSNKSIRNIIIPLNMMYNDLLSDGEISKNPIANLKLPKPITREPKPFTQKEVQAILENISSPEARNYFLFALETGLRTSEQLALTWDDVDWENRKVFINKAKVRAHLKAPKTNAGTRSVDLSDKAIASLKSLRCFSKQENVFINPTTGRAWRDGKSLREHYWKPALTKAEIPYRPPHQCRHTYASRKLSVEKVPPIWLAMQMGHSSELQVFQSYARWIE